MITQYWVSIEDKQRWNELVALNQHHQLAHTFDYNDAMYQASGEAIYLYAAVGQDFNCVCPYAVRQKKQGDALDVHTPYGFSGLAIDGYYENFHVERKQFMAEQGFVCGYMLQHPQLIANQGAAFDSLISGKTGFTIHLNQDIATIFSQFSTDHRQRYRRWQKENIKVELDTKKQHADAFIQLYHSTLTLREASSVYDFGREAWMRLIHHPHAYLFYVEEQNQITAAALFFAYRKNVDYYMTATTEVGKKHTRGLIVQAIEFFKAAGNETLFLGCGIHENDALHTYKARFGGEARPTYSYKEIYDQTQYEAMCQKYSVSLISETGFFPAYWAA